MRFGTGSRRVAGVLAAAGLALSMTACGAKEFRVQEPPSAPLNTFGQIEVVPFTVELPAETEPERRAQANELLLAVRKRLNERLAKAELFSGEGKKLVIQGKLVHFDPGSQAARYMIGFGAGSGEIVTEVTFADEAGKTVARGAAVGGVSGGWFGGSLASAARRQADAIYKVIANNHESVSDTADKQEPSGPRAKGH